MSGCKKFVRHLRKKGHEITFEWTAFPSVKPYNENQKEAAQYAKQGIDGVAEADVYILFAHEDGNGVYTEFGAALASHTIQGKPEIYAIDNEKQWAAMFHYHPAITWCDSIEEVFAQIGAE